MDKISILIAEHREITRAGMRSVLAAEADLAVVGETADTKELFQLAEKKNPDIVLLGLALPYDQLLQTLKEVGRRSPHSRTIILTDHAVEPNILEFVRAGAKGHLQNTTSEASLKKAVRTVAGKEYWVDRKMIGTLFGEFLRLLSPPVPSHEKGPVTTPLTKRELEVLKLLAQGCKNKEIAKRLFISEKTVKTHLTNIFSKLKISDRLQAALYVIERRLGT